MKIHFIFFSTFLLLITLTKSQNPLSFHYSTFNETITKNNISLFGDATLEKNGTIKLTKFEDSSLAATPDSAGQVVNNAVLTTSSSSISFFTNFSFSFSKVHYPKYSGNGFTFFFTPHPLQSKFPPVGKFGLPKNFLSIVIDTTVKKDNVVAYITLSINNTYKPLESAPIGDSLDISNGHVFYTWIEYDSQSKNFSAFINSTNVKPKYPVLFATIDLSAFFKNYSTLYLGFSALSLLQSEVYEIHSWDFTAIPDEFHKHRNMVKIVLPSVAATVVLVILLALCYLYGNCALCIWIACLGHFQGPPGTVEMVP
jgi:hypothetical protein